jgi:hypothetical protein
MSRVAIILAQAAQASGAPPGLSPRIKVWALLLFLLMMSIIALTAIALLVAIRRRGRAGRGADGGAGPRRHKQTTDPWSEAANRLKLEKKENESEHVSTGDTVDIDPSELSPGDVEPDSHDDDDRGKDDGDTKHNGENGHNKPKEPRK